MKRQSIGCLVACLALAGCKPSIPPPPSPQPSSQPLAFDAATQPSPKEILRVLLRNQHVRLSADASCSGAGTEPKDSDLGDYLSGFLAEQNQPTGKNWIEISARPEAQTGNQRLWRGDVTIRHRDGEDRWGWGVTFLMNATDHDAVQGSFRCTGAG